MQFVRYTTGDRRPRLGLLLDGRVHDLEATSAGRAAGGDMRALITQGRTVVDAVAAAARNSAGVQLEGVRLLAPIANPGKLIAVAGGYYADADAERLGPDAHPDAVREANRRHRWARRPDHDLEEIAGRRRRDRGRDRHRRGRQEHPA